MVREEFRIHVSHREALPSLPSWPVTRISPGSTSIAGHSGASDGAVKLWDSRFVASRQGKRRSEPAPLHTLTPRRTGLGRRHGIVCLSVDASGKRMLAGSADNTIYVYDTVRPSEGEVAQLRHGPRIDSFYIRAAFSPDGRFVISGSSDENVYLFDVRREPKGALAKGSPLTGACACV